MNEQNICKTSMDNSLQDMIKPRFKLLLDGAGLSQVEAARKLGLEPNYFWKITNGCQIPPARLRVRIAQLLKTDSCLIWRWEEFEENKNENME